MHVLKPLLLLLACTLATATASRAAEDTETLTYHGSGYNHFYWHPFENIKVMVKFGIVEIHPDPSRPEGNIWRSPRPREPYAPPASGVSLELVQVLDWTLPGRGGAITVNRQPESIDGRLVIRDSWETSPTEGAFITHEFILDRAEFPDCTLTLIDPQDPTYAPRVPTIEGLLKPGQVHFTHGPDPVLRTVELGAVHGGTMRFTVAQPMRFSLHPGNTPTEFRLRFMPVDIQPPLASGAAIMTVEWTPRVR
jgi:hypothetical protein